MRTLLLMLLAAAILGGCQKDEDLREIFIGTWMGTETHRMPTFGYDETFNSTMVIKKVGSEGNRISIKYAGAPEQIAIVDGGIYRYEKIVIQDVINGLAATWEIEGTGKINSGRLQESGTLILFYDGLVFHGTWFSNYDRQ